jgi:uncharacterized protein YdeI (YjbR/CyaY-like superfamily)
MNKDEIVFFDSINDFRDWLAENHKTSTEIQIGFYKKDSGTFNFSWSESVDHAICFGWIDGIRKSVDEISYTIRFTPRNPKSIWSAINIEKVERLSSLGLMEEAGIAAFEKRNEAKSKIYAYEQENPVFNEDQTAIFKGNQKAWDFFQNQAASYRKVLTWWVISAKQEKTRENRLSKLIAASENGQRL